MTIPFNVVAVSAVFLAGSVTALWLGCMWRHRDRPHGSPVSISDLIEAPPAPPERRLWDGEAWETLRTDPRDLWTEVDDARLRHPSSRRYGSRSTNGRGQ